MAAGRQERIGAELLERLQFFGLEPRDVVDLGCGTGSGAAALRARFPRARVIAIDSAFEMARAALRRQRFWRRFDCICADGRALPLAAQSADLVYCNLVLHSCANPLGLFAEVQRVLRSGGLLLFSSLGAETLRELREACALAGESPQLSEFVDMPGLGAAMAQAGLAEPVMDRELELVHYADARVLLREARTIGARRTDRERRNNLGGARPVRAVLAAYETLRTGAGIPASWEIIYGAAFAGPREAKRDGEITVAASAIGTRRKDA